MNPGVSKVIALNCLFVSDVEGSVKVKFFVMSVRCFSKQMGDACMYRRALIATMVAVLLAVCLQTCAKYCREGWIV